MPIYKKGQIIAWLNEKTGEVLCPDCFEDEKDFLPLTSNCPYAVIICDECETILNE